MNGDDEPTSNVSWVALKVIMAAVVLGLILVFVIDVGGGH